MGEDSEDWSKVTVPPTVESPRRTATVVRRGVSCWFCYALRGWRAISEIGVGEERKVTDGEWKVWCCGCSG